MSDNSAKLKAQQAVAQTTAIAVQDAADNLRNISTVTSTAIGVALAQLLATGDEKYIKVIDEAEKALASAVENFATVGEKAAKILEGFS
ncbi:hypothetical protein [Agarilytica rhodophyticola]|uniref:hypothetical protein n=1 Tax=Agarilytica rhodophyticola TaxID=1737490 RepID=UPI000B342415|nr:hypothetical protein [Agarilytica rhodophyticola]